MIGRVRLTFRRRGEATAIFERYQEQALKLRAPASDPGWPCEAVIVNTAGGVVGGDRLDIAVRAEAGARAVVTTPAAEKVYRSAGPAATIAARLVVEEGAALDWLPQETILFNGARLERSLSAEVHPGGALLAAEMVAFGRAAHGESLTLASLLDRWRIRRAGRLVFADTTRLEGDVAGRLAARAAGAGARASASLVCVAQGAEQRLDALRAVAEAVGAEVEHGASAFDGLLVFRAVAPHAAPLRRVMTGVLEALRGPVPRVWRT